MSGEKFWTFLTRNVLQPLGMTHTIDLDTERAKLEPVGYMRHALGPLRPAIPEAPGWYFADGSMAMPVGDLLTWDISLMNRSMLSAASYDAMETDTRLKNGGTAHYGLGLSVATRDGHPVISHGGEIMGFVAQNIVYPDEKIAIAVLTNQGASAAAGSIARTISALVLPAAGDSDAAKAEAQVRQILEGLQQGRIDRSLFTANANFYFDAVAIGDYQKSLAPLGAIQSLTQSSTLLRGGMTFRAFKVVFANGTRARVTTYVTSDGKLEQFLMDVA